MANSDSFSMPRSQSCPICGARSKRVAMTKTGATYCCRTHDEFAVVHPNNRGGVK